MNNASKSLIYLSIIRKYNVLSYFSYKYVISRNMFVKHYAPSISLSIHNAKVGKGHTTGINPRRFTEITDTNHDQNYTECYRKRRIKLIKKKKKKKKV